MANTFQLKLRQTQQLHQNVQQSLRVLHMSGIELEREVEEWLEENPLLERVEQIESWQPSFSTVLPSHRSLSIDNEENSATWEAVAVEEDFNTFLHKQVCEHPLDEQETALVHLLIDSLDEQGYLADSINDLVENLPLDWRVDEHNLGHALKKLQQFEPAGVGAIDLSESLVLQLQRESEQNDTVSCAIEIAKRFLPELKRSQTQLLSIIKKALPKYEKATIQSALKLIGRLNPFPAYGYASADSTAFVQPEIWVNEGAKGWQINDNQTAWPQIQLNQEYSDLLKSDESLDSIWKEKINEARTKIESLAYRKSTVLRLAEYIVEKQEDFFVFGEIALVPLLLRDAAAELELAESTISRAANEKYLACPRGVFALRYFFTQAATGNEENGVSKKAVESILVELVNGENKQKPYSDSALADLLKLQGIEIARRTVAKYREALNIAPAHQRKEQQ